MSQTDLGPADLPQQEQVPERQVVDPAIDPDREDDTTEEPDED